MNERWAILPPNSAVDNRPSPIDNRPKSLWQRNTSKVRRLPHCPVTIAVTITVMAIVVVTPPPPPPPSPAPKTLNLCPEVSNR
ncbi:hypothetical protein M5D96_001388 [Drosophila gunungcola]|uniref:Uncharacterized protein n=1 Tax=Drosophila gunungcola TaxID=103775 RepID=A0A9P9YYJ0_9MUSC|nr:hypothetical protein M5D96_001388 [Drosophila gunungcola]